MKMSKIQGLRGLVKQFLSVAADEIVEAVEEIIADYEEEMFQSKREISRQRKMLDELLQPEIKLNRISEEAQLNLSVWEEDFGTEQQQEWNSSPRQKNPESLQTERSHKEHLSSSQDRRPEDDTIHDTFTPQCEENEQKIYKEEEEAVQVPIETDEEVPSPGFSEAENGDEDEDWKLSNANQDTDSDRSEEWRHSTVTAKTPRMKKKLKSCIICKVCGKSFHAKVSLVNHLEIHPKDLCGLCGRHCQTEEDFKLHLKTHLNVKAVVCVVCGKGFGSRSSLVIHKRIHTGAKPFRCGECGKSFNCRPNLTRHVRIHTGNKPYSCALCSKCFSDCTALKRHTQTHLRDKTLSVTTPAVDDGGGNAEKDSTAQTSQSFEHEEDIFKRHLNTHNNRIECEICGTCFDSRANLKAHIRIHTGVKPFSCSHCGKDFCSRQNMLRHERTHTGEKPYLCTVCGRCFSDSSSLKRHITVHIDA